MKMNGRKPAEILGEVTFLPDQNVPVGAKELERNLLDLAVRNKVPIGHSCGGGGSCGTCRVIVVEGLDRLEVRGDVEQAMADDRGFAPQERLACQISPVVGLKVEVPAIEPELDW
jgi:2Fe-2S ferredoxin